MSDSARVHPPTDPPAPSAAPSTAPSAVPPPAARQDSSGTDGWKERGIKVRVLLYVVGAHVLAAILWLFFYVGAHAHK